MLVEFSLDNSTAREIEVSSMFITLRRRELRGKHFVVLHITSLNEKLFEIEKLFLTCGGYDTTYPIGCTIHPLPLSDDRYRLCDRKSGDIPGIVYGKISCYFKLSGVDDGDIIKGALQYATR
jgi:hypothetical protein